MRLGWIALGLMFGCTDGSTAEPVDADGDGVPSTLDCDDDDAEIAPGQPERCDGKDNNCNGLVDDEAADAKRWHRDVDGDGYGDADVSVKRCDSPGDGFVDNGDDCNDLFENSYPGADEICDGNDNDCDDQIDEDPIDAPDWYRDADNDGFGIDTDSVNACAPPTGYVSGRGDCDDEDENQNPRADERCNGEDDDCDSRIDEDAVDAVEQYPDKDGDGHGSPEGPTVQACTPPDGYASAPDDCDDAEPAAYPGATEICDGVDNDCDSATEEDGLVTADGTNVSDLDAAVAAVSAGGTISVCPGTYSVALTVSTDVTIDAPYAADTTVLRPSDADTSIITVDSGASVTLSGLTFDSGEAPTGGAVDATTGGDLAIRDCTFTDNLATDGGAIAANTSLTTTTITGSTFRGNLATDRGGAVYAGAITIETSTMESNTATTGGALYLSGGSAALDVDSVIEFNEATEDGGGVAISGANGVTGGTISDNEAGRNGGGVWVDDGGTMTAVAMDRNAAVEDGGAIYAAGEATLETLALFDNTATRGGGIATSNGDVDIGASELSGNIASDSGGGIAALGSGTVVVNGSIVTANEATSGGGAWLEDGTLESISSDWGTSSLDNDPDDVAISGGDTYDSYSGSASFTCTATDGTCS